MKRLTVVQSLPLWLPLTSPWLFNQVRHLPTEVKSIVVAEKTANLDQYAIENLNSLERCSHGRSLWDKGLRKLGVRDHLGYLVRVAKRHGAAIVHSHWGDWGWRDREGAIAADARHVVTFYGKDVNYLPRLGRWAGRYRELFQSVDLVLCEGPHMASCIEELGCSTRKLAVHHLGVEVANIRFEPRRRGPGDPLKVLIAASFREKKGIPYALEALGRLGEREAIELTIIGDASNDPRSHPEKTTILATLDRWKLAGRTRMLGYQRHDAFFREIYGHHIFLSPSVTAHDGDTEGGAPVSIIEASASGMPVVSTRHCDIPSVILDGRTGLLAPERDVGALVGHLERLAGRPDSWETMGRAARRHIEAEYDANVQARLLAGLYASLTGGDRADAFGY